MSDRRAVLWRSLRRVCLALLAAGSASGMAVAGPVVVSTTGVVTSGTDLAGNNLAGDQYSLALTFAGLGSSTFSNANNATTQGGLLGTAVAKVGGAIYTSTITEDFGSLIDLTPFAITAQLVGDDASSQVTDASISLDSAAGGFGPPGFTQQLSYTAKAGDSGADSYAFTNAAGLTVSFNGTPQSIGVPEPASGALLLAGLCSLALVSGRLPRPRRGG